MLAKSQGLQTDVFVHDPCIAHPPNSRKTTRSIIHILRGISNGWFIYNPALRSRSKTAYFSSSSLTEIPIFSSKNGFLI